MVIGVRLRRLRKSKNLTQGDIQERCGLLRFYVSRVENGYTVPSVDTLEKWANALEVPLYRIFYEGTRPPPRWPAYLSIGRALSKKDAALLERFRTLFARMKESDRQLILQTAHKLSHR